jgi:hypothetical protein
MRLALRQIWSVMASRSDCVSRDAARQRCREIKKRHAGNASNGQTRHKRFEASVSTTINQPQLNVTQTFGAEPQRTLLVEMFDKPEQVFASV